ncbi:intermembrane phospholipid transport protein YdbH family protein, partial [Pantoea septica]
MPRSLRRLLAALLALTLLVLGLLLTVTQWLPRLAGIWLPAETRIVLEGSPRWRNGGLWFPQVRYLAGECALASVDQASLGWHDRRWRL